MPRAKCGKSTERTVDFYLTECTRKALPEGSPLEGMGEADAASWALSHGVDELAQDLGVSRATAYRRLRSGRVL